MKSFEVTFIVDPVLSGDEIKTTAKTYQDMLGKEGCTITATDEMGLRQLAYPINKRNSGVYYCIEYTTDNPSINSKIELALKRDERIMRFLTIGLDKYGVKYNNDKRSGLIGKKERPKKDDGQKNQVKKKIAQDLTKIEGIGPKIAQLLQGAGIITYKDLTEASPKAIRDILSKAGSTYEIHDPTSWPEQAKYAADSKWNELHRYQKTLVGGVAAGKSEEE